MTSEETTDVLEPEPLPEPNEPIAQPHRDRKRSKSRASRTMLLGNVPAVCPHAIGPSADPRMCVACLLAAGVAIGITRHRPGTLDVTRRAMAADMSVADVVELLEEEAS